MHAMRKSTLTQGFTSTSQTENKERTHIQNTHTQNAVPSIVVVVCVRCSCVFVLVFVVSNGSFLANARENLSDDVYLADRAINTHSASK